MMSDASPVDRLPPSPPANRAEAIGSRLRQIYDDAATEPMPKAFEELLRKLG